MSRFCCVSENRLRCKVELLMAQFEVKRHAHRFCVDEIHYVVFSDGNLFVLHIDQLDETDGEVLLAAKEIHEIFVSESQRETLRSRLKALLKGKI